MGLQAWKGFDKKMSLQKRLDYMLHNHYHARGGKVGTVIGLAAVLFFIAGVLVSVQEKGQGGPEVGLCGLASMACALIGLISCMIGFKEEDMFYLYAWIGAVINGGVLVVIFCMYLVGL